MSDEVTHYDVLGVSPTASKNEVRAAYQAALDGARTAGDADHEADVRRAWQVLSDPVQRQRYDERIGVGRRDSRERPPRESDADEDTDDDGVEPQGYAADDGVEFVDELVPGAPRAGGSLPLGSPAFLEQPTLGRRLVASFIDVMTTVAVVAASIAIAFSITSSDSTRGAAIIAAYELWVVALFVVPTWRNGQTLGKRFTYIMCVDRTSGELLGAFQVVSRYAIPMLLVPALGQLGPVFALFFGLSYAMAREQLSLADRVSRSIVVVARYQPRRRAHGA